MKELWIKKTIWSRHLIEDDDIHDVQVILEDSDNGVALVVDCYDKNPEQEYDNEAPIMPIQFEVKEI